MNSSSALRRNTALAVALTVGALNPGVLAAPASAQVWIELTAEQSEALGAPQGDATSVTAHGQTGLKQTFQNGTAYQSSFGTFTLTTDAELALNGRAGVDGVGWPISEPTTITGDGITGTTQSFASAGGVETGRVLSHNGVTAVVKGLPFVEVRDKGLDFTGWPLANEVYVGAAGTAGWHQTFTRGMVALRAGTQTGFHVQGDLYKRFVAQGGIEAKGWPTSNYKWLNRCGYWTQDFTRATQFGADDRWCPAATNSQPVLTQPSAGKGYTLYAGYNGTAVYFAQKALGMATTATNTKIGPATQKALVAWKSRNGLGTAVSIDANVWARLNTGMPFNTSSWAKESDVPVSATPAARVQQMINYTYSQLGKPYIWGATGNAGNPVGFDCSGLMLQAARSAGVKFTQFSNWNNVQPSSDLANTMFHASELQRTTASDLRVGDWVFYGTPATSAKAARAGHVAMYVGNGMAIQASPGKDNKVVVHPVSFSSGWGSIIGYRRPIATTGASAGAPTAAAPRLGKSAPLSTTASDTTATPTMVLDQSPLAPANTTIINGVLTASATQVAGSGVVASVKAGQRFTVPAGSKVLFAGSGWVVGVSTNTDVTAPAGATQVIVVEKSALPGAGIDSAVTPLR